MKKVVIAGEIANDAIYELNKQVLSIGNMPILERERVRDIVRNSALKVLNSIEENIGQFLIRIGAMKKYQVRDVLLAQKKGDPRVFGEIAIEFGYIDDKAIKGYLESKKGPKK